MKTGIIFCDHRYIDKATNASVNKTNSSESVPHKNFLGSSSTSFFYTFKSPIFTQGMITNHPKNKTSTK